MTDEERIQHMQVLWKKGRNMYGSFFAMLGEKRKEIGDEALSNWCFNHLHIGLYACLEVSKCLKEADRKMVQSELDYARRADREKQRIELEALRREQEAIKALRDAEKAEAERLIEAAEEAAGDFGDFTHTQILEVTDRYFKRNESEIAITKAMFNPNARRASNIVSRIIGFEKGRQHYEAKLSGVPVPTPGSGGRKKNGGKRRNTPPPPSAGPKPPTPTPTPPTVVPTPATPINPIAGPLEFPKTLTAARAMERDQWALGDALIEECGPPGKHGVKDGSRVRIAKAAEYLHRNGCGFGYSEESLRVFRDISHLYPEGIRVPSVSWTAHRVVPGPEWMVRISADVPAGELTVNKAKEMVAAMHDGKVVLLRQPEAVTS